MKKQRNVLAMICNLILALIISTGHQSYGQEQTIVLDNCNIIDCTGAKLKKDMHVIIKGNTITEINKGSYSGQVNESTKVIDTEDGFVMPGLWNMHTHLTAMLPDPNNIEFNETVASASIRAGLNAMDGLRNGFTSVRSVGERDYLDVEWGNAFDEGYFMGPRIFASGKPVSPTAGHRKMVKEGSDGVAAVRKAVRERIQNGADVIKLFSVEMTDDEVEAAIEVAHGFGIPLTTHTREPDTYRTVKAGIDCIEHGYEISDRTIQLMAEMGTYYSPTIICNLSKEYIIEREKRLEALGYADDKRISYYRMAINFADERSPEFALYQRQALKKAADAGVKIVLGSDSMPVGELGILELEQFVLSGLTEMQALVAATKNCADVQRMGDKLGTVEVGKWADLIVLSKNPLENISYIRELKMVFKDGYMVDLDQPSGPGGYWDYYKPLDPSGELLEEAKEEAGF